MAAQFVLLWVPENLRESWELSVDSNVNKKPSSNTVTQISFFSAVKATILSPTTPAPLDIILPFKDLSDVMFGDF